MRIGVDGRSLVQARGRGIARYTHTLLCDLAAAFPADEWRVLVPAGPAQAGIPGIELVRAPVPGRVLDGLAGALGRPRLDRLLGGVDVFWAPSPAPLALSREVPLVLTLHDLAWELRPADFTAYERLWHRIARPRLLGERATRTIAVSDFTRELAIERWSLDPRRMLTIHEGVRARPEREPAQRARPGAYFLSVGALEPRKAPDVLVRAYQRARGEGLRAELLIAGEGSRGSELAGAGVQLLGHVSDAELDQLYHGALALVMPSRFEGFGLPPLEAALHGTPSIVSDLPVFRETLGDAALRVPVDDVAALAAAMQTLSDDGDLRSLLAGRALQRARQFSPQRAAAAVHGVLAAAAKG